MNAIFLERILLLLILMPVPYEYIYIHSLMEYENDQVIEYMYEAKFRGNRDWDKILSCIFFPNVIRHYTVLKISGRGCSPTWTVYQLSSMDYGEEVFIRHSMEVFSVDQYSVFEENSLNRESKSNQTIP